MQGKPQWMTDHEEADNQRFNEISGKLDSLLEIASAFRLGGRGIAWIIGLLVGLGTLVIIVMKIFGK